MANDVKAVTVGDVKAVIIKSGERKEADCTDDFAVLFFLRKLLNPSHRTVQQKGLNAVVDWIQSENTNCMAAVVNGVAAEFGQFTSARQRIFIETMTQSPHVSADHLRGFVDRLKIEMCDPDIRQFAVKTFTESRKLNAKGLQGLGGQIVRLAMQNFGVNAEAYTPLAKCVMNAPNSDESVFGIMGLGVLAAVQDFGITYRDSLEPLLNPLIASDKMPTTIKGELEKFVASKSPCRGNPDFRALFPAL